MRLGIVIRKYRIMQELTLRKLAAEIGVSAATLLRIEQGKDSDGKTLAKVMTWLLKEPRP